MSAEKFAVVKLATTLCNAKELKREILCSAGSECFNRIEKVSFEFEIWNQIVEKKSKTILKSLGLPVKLQDKVLGAILTIGKKMLIWAKYHEQILGLSSEQVIEFLKIQCFTPQGTIDNKKVSEELINDRNLCVKQKYVLACLHYHTDLITLLYREMNENDRKECYDDEYPSVMKKPGFVKYLTSCLIEKEETLNIVDNVEYALQQAVDSGSMKAVKGVLEFVDSRGENDYIILSIAKKAFRNIKETETKWAGNIPMKFSRFVKFWTPVDYYLEIIFFLLPRMRNDQIGELISGDEGNFVYERHGTVVYSNLLTYFLNWPYQDYFLKTVSLTWNSLPKETYCDLLRTICQKFEPEANGLSYGEEKNYDYIGLLREFWCVSPEDFKRYVFSSSYYSEIFDMDTVLSADLLGTLLKLKHFTDEHGELIRLFTASATDVEKEDIFFYDENRTGWVEFMQQERWEVFYRLVIYCFVNKQEGDKFKRKFICTVSTRVTCLYLLKEKNYSALHSFIEWTSLPEEEIKELKRAVGFSDAAKESCVAFAEEDNWNEIDSVFNWCCLSGEEIKKVKFEAIYSDNGKHLCRKICFRKGGEKAKLFCKKFLSTEEEVISFRKELVSIHSFSDKEDCITLLKKFGGEFVSDFIYFCILPEEDIKVLKNVITHSDLGRRLCKRLCLTEGVDKAKKFCEVFFTTEEEIRKFRKELDFIEDFKVSDWVSLLKRDGVEGVNAVLNFCLISEEKLKEFKEYVGSLDGIGIYTNFITHYDDWWKPFPGSNWEEVEQFLTWCFPSEQKIKSFKNLLLEDAGTFIHFYLICQNKWEEAETFFAWLELTGDEINKLKKAMLCNEEEMFSDLRRRLHDESNVDKYGGKEGAMELFLMWVVNDKEVDMKLIHKLKRLFEPKDEGDFYINFEMLLEEHLTCLDDEKVYMKRKKIESMYPNKKLHISKNMK